MAILSNYPAIVAEGMFNAYGEHCGWKTFDGRDMPRWQDVNDAVRGHWYAAALWAIKKVKGDQL